MPKRPTSPQLPAGASCPCGGSPTGAAYAHCCAPLIDAQQAAPDAASLMRSRYTAYTQDNFAYLRQTWHPDTCPADLGQRERDEVQARWLGLSIKRHTALDAQHAEVEFIARYKLAGRAHRLHEISRFIRLDGKWLYLDGQLFE